MKNNKRIKLSVLIIILITIVGISIKSHAGVTISQSSISMDEGTSKTLSLSASDATGTVSVSTSNATVATVTAADNWIDDGKSINITITGKSKGTATITINGIVSDNLGNDSEYSKTINVTVNSKVTEQPSASNNTSTATPTISTTTTEKSSVATLSNLGIRPNDFSGFKSNTYTYNVEVSNEVESVEVYASKGQSGQTISGTGTKTLNEGENKLEVTVTAEDGITKKIYTINVTRGAKEEVEEEEPVEEQPMEEIFGLTELKIEGYQLEPQFQTDVYEYKIDLKEEIQTLKITTLAAKANSEIEITGNENLQEGENIITIIVKGENDAETVAYQIIVNKTTSVAENTINLEEDHQQMFSKIIIISVAAGVILLIIIIAIIVKIKKSKNKDNNYIPYENLMNDYEDKEEVEEQTIEDDEQEFYEEEPRKKKRSKGKRFK